MQFEEFAKQMTEEARPQAGPRVYLFVGKDDFLKGKAETLLLDRYTDASLRSFSLDVFSIKESPVDAALAQARTAPMLGGCRIVLVRHAEALKEAALTGLKKYLQNPTPFSILVFDAEELDTKNALHKLITKHGAVVDFAPLRGHGLVKWVDVYIRRHGYSAELAVVQKIVDLTGANLHAVTSELEKIFTYLGGGLSREITHGIVSDLAIRSRQNTVFELTDAIGRKQRKRALQLLQNLILDGQDPLGILAMMARHFRQLLMVKEMVKRQASTKEIVAQTQVKDFMVDEYVRQAKTFTDEEAIRSFHLLAAADGLFKGGGLHPQTHLEWIICRATR